MDQNKSNLAQQDIPLERDGFMRTLIGHLAGALQDVIGLDADPAMIAEAKQQSPHLTFEVGDARQFTLPAPVDAIFSNATLHWVDDPVAAIKCMAAALKPGGRLVAEFGGKGNMAQVLAAIATARDPSKAKTVCCTGSKCSPPASGPTSRPNKPLSYSPKL